MSLFVNDERVTIFRVAPQSSTAPGFVQLIVGVDQPTHGYTLPIWWVNDPNPPNIKSSGDVFSHSEPLF